VLIGVVRKACHAFRDESGTRRVPRTCERACGPRADDKRAKLSRTRKKRSFGADFRGKRGILRVPRTCERACDPRADERYPQRACGARGRPSRKKVCQEL
jgi:hypothetical protein